MIKRELYMSRIRPFIGGELIKVMTGIRRSGKSVIVATLETLFSASCTFRVAVRTCSLDACIRFWNVSLLSFTFVASFLCESIQLCSCRANF